MVYSKIQNNFSVKLLAPSVLKFIENLLNKTPTALMAFDLQGNLIGLNDKASQYLGVCVKQLKQHSLWDIIPLNNITRKRHYLRICECFKQAQTGLSQNYTWTEYTAGKPTLAYNIMINKEEIHKNPVIFVQLTDELPEKIMTWALWSLAKIGLHHEITEVIDEIVKLASQLFNAEYSAVCLIDSQHESHAISFYHAGKKKENNTYPFVAPSYSNLLEKRTIINALNIQTDIQTLTPDNNLFKTLGIQSYLMGPIINTDNTVVGAFNVLSTKKYSNEKMN